MSQQLSELPIDLVLERRRLFELQDSRGGSALEPSDIHVGFIQNLVGPGELDDPHLESGQHLDSSARLTETPLDHFSLCFEITDTLCQQLASIGCAPFNLFE